MRRKAKQRWAMQRLYFARWRAEARRWVPFQRETCLPLCIAILCGKPVNKLMSDGSLLAIVHRRIEERMRQERLAANLKACRVGGTSARKVGGWFASLQHFLPRSVLSVRLLCLYTLFRYSLSLKLQA